RGVGECLTKAFWFEARRLAVNGDPVPFEVDGDFVVSWRERYDRLRRRVPAVGLVRALRRPVVTTLLEIERKHGLTFRKFLRDESRAGRGLDAIAHDDAPLSFQRTVAEGDVVDMSRFAIGIGKL